MDDIWYCIYLVLDVGDAYRLSLVCLNCYGVFMKESLWKEYYLGKFGGYNLRGSYYDTYKIYSIVINFEKKYDVGITNLDNLDTSLQINLNNRDLKTIPTEVLLFKYLDYLAVSYNNINIIPTELFTLTNLKRLEIENTNITSIPSEISKLCNLKYLFLSNNNIKIFPTEILLVNQLRYLNLSHNQITEIPKEISLLQQLTGLNLSFNNINNMPTEIMLLTKITYLKLEKYSDEMSKLSDYCI